MRTRLVSRTAVSVMVPTTSTPACQGGRECSFSGCWGGVPRNNRLDLAEPETRCQRDRDGNRAVCPPELGSDALTAPGRHAAPDADRFVVLDGPCKTVQANGTDGADADRSGPTVRVDRKPQVSLMPETHRQLTPRCRAQVQFVFASGGIWRNQESTRFMTPSMSRASPGSGARFPRYLRRGHLWRNDSPKTFSGRRALRRSRNPARPAVDVHAVDETCCACRSRRVCRHRNSGGCCAQGSEDSTSVKKSPWAAPAPDLSLRPRNTKAMPTATTAPASGSAA